MSNYLTSAFGVLRKDAFGLAWNGVIDSDVFSKADTNKLFNYTYTENRTSHTVSVSKREIMNHTGAYNGMQTIPMKEKKDNYVYLLSKLICSTNRKKISTGKL